MVFDYNFVSVLFGVAGTFILLFSSIFSYNKNIKNKEKYALISKMIGFLFLFDSFLYLLWPKISSQVGSIPPITEFFYWPYYFFIGVGIIISLSLVKEKNSGWGLEVSFDVNSLLKFGVFYSPIIFAFLVMILNADFLLIITIVAWFKFMEMLRLKD